MNISTFLILVSSCSALAGCAMMADLTAPRKVATADRTAAALNADKVFWATLHSGNYGGIGKALEVQTAAYLADPKDAISAAHTGWLYIWRLSESQRLDALPATITESAVLARKYFEEAVALQSNEARYRGFYAAALLTEGNIHQDERLTRRGYFTMLDAIKQWPEFNLFTGGYVFSRRPAESEQFKQGLDWQWQALDACTGASVDRKNPDYSQYMKLETIEGVKRVCWNSWIAPHNFEGFFLNMGDMLVKSGDWQTARTIYANARLSTTYNQWPYRQELEDRIRDSQQNVAAFSAPQSAQANKDKTIMVGSKFSCMACHQK
jgi:hypothetical protein